MATLVLAACGSERNPGPMVDAVRPELVSAVDTTTVVISGKNFYTKVKRFELNNESALVLDEGFVVEVDGTMISPDSILSASVTAIEVVLPSGLQAGAHDLSVRIPDGRWHELNDAFTVVDCLVDVCGDGVCCAGAGETACGCPEDCATGCGDGCCQADEDASNCAADCPDFCGDTFCTGSEDCTNCAEDCATGCGDGCCMAPEDASTCSMDCPDLCGDTVCTGSETCTSCLSDCGAGCGDGCCTAPEDAQSCSLDCSDVCGDGLCTGVETMATCPADCQRTTQMVTGKEYSCRLKSEGTVWCSGRNDKNQLGIGVADNSLVPVQVVGEGNVGVLTDVDDIAGGEKHACVVRSNGGVWCWGHNEKGELGDDTTVNSSSTPVQTMGLSAVTHIDAGNKQTCARKSDGTVWCWGENNHGQLGDGTKTVSRVPVQVKGVGGIGVLTDISDIGIGFSFSCGIVDSDRSLVCWGQNEKGQLGRGTTSAEELEPLQVSGLTDVVDIGACHKHTCVAKSDGSAWCWGENNHGQLGNDAIVDQLLPERVQGVGGVGFLADVVGIGCGETYSCAIKSDGSVWCWGQDDRGQLGDGTPVSDSLYPVQVVDGAGPVNSVTAPIKSFGGGEHICVGKTDNTGFCWGDNGWGQLGDDSEIDRFEAVPFL